MTAEDRGADSDRKNGDTSGNGLPGRAGWVFLALTIIGLIAWAIVAAQDSGTEISLPGLLAWLREAAKHPIAPLMVVPAFVAGSLLVAPLTGMIAICALLFSPAVASVSAIAGTLAATAVNFRIGKRLGRVVDQKAPPELTERIQALGENADAWSFAGLRLIPVAPFTVINLLAGALRVNLPKFLVGTLIGMGPAIVLICYSVDRARAALSGEPVFEPWLLAVIAITGAMVVGFRVWQNRRDAAGLAD